jgi:FAD dependent monooxygenase
MPYSLTRKLMWEYDSNTRTHSIPETDKSVIFSEFGGLFGVSMQQESFGLSSAESHVILGHGNTKLLFTQPGRVYWAIVFKEKVCKPAKRSKAMEAEVEAIARKHADQPMTEVSILCWNCG